ncbi:MAG TPA: thiamine-phosphate kinase [Steroidobacteraceae bacterium]|nr:thiamine-phosphate kinase [Steroidobacteraceae bacterium]
MPPGEFELIERYFRQPAEALRIRRGDVPLGIGDDGALLRPPPGRELVAVLDTLVAGRHFPAGSPPRSIGHRALAVNLSDLAAMGAQPAWFLLALTLPAAEEAFLDAFAQGLFELAQQHGMALVGGDTTAGPLAVSVQALGFVDAGTALRRGGAMPGDLLYVSGAPGEAAAGLQLALGEPAAALRDEQRQWLFERFHFPAPRIALGQALRGIASACIDVSDGLAADAGKLAAASGCAVTIEVERLPLSAALHAQAGTQAAQLALAGGDDYELCFTVPPDRIAGLDGRLAGAGCAVTRIGHLEVGSGVMFSGKGIPPFGVLAGYEHFRAR